MRDNLKLTIIQIQPDFKFEINGTQVTDLYVPEIDKTVPIVAAYECIRECVREMQRKIADTGQGDSCRSGYWDGGIA